MNEIRYERPDADDVLKLVPKAPPLGAQTGKVVRVASSEQLVAALAAAEPGSTILVADGHYVLDRAEIAGVDGVTIRSESGDRDKVVLDGECQVHADAGGPRVQGPDRRRHDHGQLQAVRHLHAGRQRLPAHARVQHEDTHRGAVDLGECLGDLADLVGAAPVDVEHATDHGGGPGSDLVRAELAGCGGPQFRDDRGEAFEGDRVRRVPQPPQLTRGLSGDGGGHQHREEQRQCDRRGLDTHLADLVGAGVST